MNASDLNGAGYALVLKQEYIFEILLGSRNLFQKLSLVNCILSGLGITQNDSNYYPYKKRQLVNLVTQT